MKPRLKGPIVYPGGFATNANGCKGWITDIWVYNLTTNLPYMERAFTPFYFHPALVSHKFDVHRAITKLLTEAVGAKTG